MAFIDQAMAEGRFLKAENLYHLSCVISKLSMKFLRILVSTIVRKSWNSHLVAYRNWMLEAGVENQGTTVAQRLSMLKAVDDWSR